MNLFYEGEDRVITESNLDLKRLNINKKKENNLAWIAGIMVLIGGIIELFPIINLSDFNLFYKISTIILCYLPEFLLGILLFRKVRCKTDCNFPLYLKIAKYLFYIILVPNLVVKILSLFNILFTVFVIILMSDEIDVKNPKIEDKIELEKTIKIFSLIVLIYSFLIFISIFIVFIYLKILESSKNFIIPDCYIIYWLIMIPGYLITAMWGFNPYKRENPVIYRFSIPMLKVILLSIFTFGIWNLIWVYKTTKFTNQINKRNELKEILLYIFIPFYSVYWAYKTAQLLEIMSKERNINCETPSLVLVLSIIANFATPILLQDNINKVIQIEEIQNKS